MERMRADTLRRTIPGLFGEPNRVELDRLTPFNFDAWVDIPPTLDAFTLKLNVHWRDASNTIIRTDTQ